MSCVSYKVEKHITKCFLDIDTSVEVRVSSTRGYLPYKVMGLPTAARMADFPRSLLR